MFSLWLKNPSSQPTCYLPTHWAISSHLPSELESLPSGPSPEGSLSPTLATIILCRSSCIHRSLFLRWEMHMHSCNYLSITFIPDHLDYNSIKATMEAIAFVRYCGLSCQCNLGLNKFLGESMKTFFITNQLWEERVQQETWYTIYRAPGEAFMRGGRHSKRETPCFPTSKYAKKF